MVALDFDAAVNVNFTAASPLFSTYWQFNPLFYWTADACNVSGDACLPVTLFSPCTGCNNSW